MSRASRRGSYHVRRTREWLEREGFTVAPLEVRRRVYLPAKDGQPERVLF